MRQRKSAKGESKGTPATRNVKGRNPCKPVPRRLSTASTKSKWSVVFPQPFEVASPSRRKKKREPRTPNNLPIIEERIVPVQVRACPDAWRYIGEEVTELLDYAPAKFLRRHIIGDPRRRARGWRPARRRLRAGGRNGVQIPRARPRQHQARLPLGLRQTRRGRSLRHPDMRLNDQAKRGKSLNRKGAVVAPLPQRDSIYAKRRSVGGTFFRSALRVW